MEKEKITRIQFIELKKVKKPMDPYNNISILLESKRKAILAMDIGIDLGAKGNREMNNRIWSVFWGTWGRTRLIL